MSIAIFGAGIGGLAAAHELLKTGARIDVYEKERCAGGLARSEGGPCNTKEVSWRVYFNFYSYIFKIMSQIPDDCSGTVIDHLVPFACAIFGGTELNLVDHIKLALPILTASDVRLDSWDKDTWFSSNKTAHDIPQWLGLDRFKASYEAVARIGVEQEAVQHMLGDGSPDSWVLDGPTNEVWIDPWVAYLESRGVVFHFNTAVSSVEANGAILENGVAIAAAVYIISLPVQVLASITSLVPHANELATKAAQIQLAFQLYIGINLSFGVENERPIVAVILSDTQWGLTIESKSISWKKTCAPWSVTVCQVDVRGQLNTKPFNKCTVSEAFSEIVYQIHASKKFMNMLHQNNTRFTGKFIPIVRWATMDETFTFSGHGLQTNDIKFSNNAGTKALRPSCRLTANVFMSTAYTSETLDIFSMEAAARSAAFVGAHIYGCLPPIPLTRPFSTVLFLFRVSDEFLFQIGGPHVLFVVALLLVSMFFCGVVRQICGK